MAIFVLSVDSTRVYLGFVLLFFFFAFEYAMCSRFVLKSCKSFLK